MLIRTFASNLLVEFECFSRQVSAQVEQYQVVHIGMPEKSRHGQIFGYVHLDAVPLQNPNPHIAGRLVTIDEENFLVSRPGWPPSGGGRYILTSHRVLK